jgi:hypothetical protein
MHSRFKFSEVLGGGHQIGGVEPRRDSKESLVERQWLSEGGWITTFGMSTGNEQGSGNISLYGLFGVDLALGQKHATTSAERTIVFNF